MFSRPLEIISQCNSQTEFDDFYQQEQRILQEADYEGLMVLDAGSGVQVDLGALKSIKKRVASKT